MLEKRLKEIWKNSSQTEKIKFDLSRLIIDLNDKTNNIEKAIRRRDITDFITTIISIPIFGYIAYIVPFPITKVGIILAMIGFVWGIIKRRNHNNNKKPIQLSLSFRAQLENQKANMLQEIRLLDTVLYWFIIPGFIPYAISIIGLGDPSEYGWSNTIINQVLPMPLMYKIVSLIFAIVVFAAIFWVNKRVIRKTLKPLIEDIDKVMHQLAHEN
ncbi:hypothetical protein [Aquimarina sp. Aq78]|uniref:hypothetical protein n=1 Tax=Aquimarina sp. Aq78 TaxID=1191889 RepID=UPI000D0ECB75|nr:hypothetical protein [Aquimarina sp. Aq78]